MKGKIINLAKVRAGKRGKATKERGPEPFPYGGEARVPARACVEWGLGGPVLKVLICIAAFADEGNRSCVSLRRIGQLTHVGEGNVPKIITELERCGLISRERRRRPNGSLAVNIYTVHIDTPDGGHGSSPA
jgi:hypothetical protein